MNLHRGRAVRSNAHHIPVLLFQRGARYYHAIGRVEVVGFRGGKRVDCGLAQGDQPVPAVFVCEWDAFAHFFFVCRAVVLGVALVISVYLGNCWFWAQLEGLGVCGV